MTHAAKKVDDSGVRALRRLLWKLLAEKEGLEAMVKDPSLTSPVILSGTRGLISDIEAEIAALKEVLG